MSLLKNSKERLTAKKVDQIVHIDQAFDPAILERARQIASRYRVVTEATREGGFLGWSLEMPSTLAEGASAEECVRNTYEALGWAVAELLESGERPPVPHSEQPKRTTQINIRVTPEEKLLMEEKSRHWGFKGLSDFIRALILHEVLGEKHTSIGG